MTTRALGDVLTADAAKRHRVLLIDLSALMFIDSAALQVIQRAYRQLRDGRWSPRPAASRGCWT